MKKNNVIFIPGSVEAEQINIHPKPSKQYFPQWMKDMPNTQSTIDNTLVRSTAKHCMPFMDSFTTGYTQELICDLEITYHGKDKDGNDIIRYKWHGEVQPISSREESFGDKKVLPQFDGYYNFEPHWLTQWEPKTPMGYSTVYFHPLNRLDLPFTTFSGIIETDVWHSTGPIGFLIKRGFEGIIPAGTPIYQIMFIKRDPWYSSFAEYDEKLYKRKRHSITKFVKNGYKQLYWSRKEYN